MDNIKIYDMFRLNVVQQTTLLNKIVISVGGNINFFGKDINKKTRRMCLCVCFICSS